MRPSYTVYIYAGPNNTSSQQTGWVLPTIDKHTNRLLTNKVLTFISIFYYEKSDFWRQLTIQTDIESASKLNICIKIINMDRCITYKGNPYAIKLTQIQSIGKYF